MKAPEESYSLSQDKEETTRYIAGYIMFSLKNLMEKKKSVEAVATRQVLSYWGRDTDIELIKHIFMSTPQNGLIEWTMVDLLK